VNVIVILEKILIVIAAVQQMILSLKHFSVQQDVQPLLASH